MFVELMDENGALLSDSFHDFEDANKVRDAHNTALAAAEARAEQAEAGFELEVKGHLAAVAKLKSVEDALRKLISAVHMYQLAGIPELKTVDDVITGMRTVGAKMGMVCEIANLKSKLESAATALTEARGALEEITTSVRRYHSEGYWPGASLHVLPKADAALRKLKLSLSRANDNQSAVPSPEDCTS